MSTGITHTQMEVVLLTVFWTIFYFLTNMIELAVTQLCSVGPTQPRLKMIDLFKETVKDFYIIKKTYIGDGLFDIRGGGGGIFHCDKLFFSLFLHIFFNS